MKWRNKIDGDYMIGRCSSIAQENGLERILIMPLHKKDNNEEKCRIYEKELNEELEVNRCKERIKELSTY